jgi:hypothetical protein
MLMRLVYPLFLILSARMVQTECLSDSDLAVFNLTSIHDFFQNSSSQICQSPYLMYGQCATTDSVIKAFEAFKLRFTEQSLQKLGVVVANIRRIAQRVDDILKKTDPATSNLQPASTTLGNSYRLAGTLSHLLQNSNGNSNAPDNGSNKTTKKDNVSNSNNGQGGKSNTTSTDTSTTTGSGSSSTSGNGNGSGNGSNSNSNSNTSKNPNATNSTTSSNSKNPNSDNSSSNSNGQDTNSNNAQKSNGKGVILDVAVSAQLTAFKQKTADLVEYAKPIVEPAARQKCYEAQFKILAASLCILSSGDAKSFIRRDSNGQISSIILKSDSVNEVITQCSAMLLTFCELSELRKTLTSQLGANSTITATTQQQEAYCTSTTDLKACVENATECALDMKQAIISHAFAPFTFKLVEDSDTNIVADEAEALSAVVEPVVSVTVAARRLASSPSAISYQAEEKGVDVTLFSRNCNLSHKTVEEKVHATGINLAETLTSSVGLQAILAVLKLGLITLLL